MELENGGYDAHFVEEVQDFLKCSICHFALKKPMLVVACGHRFCESCYNQMKDYATTRYC